MTGDSVELAVVGGGVAPATGRHTAADGDTATHTGAAGNSSYRQLPIDEPLSDAEAHPSNTASAKTSAPGSLGDESRATFWQKLTFSWLTPLLDSGYRQSLEKDDLARVPMNKAALGADTWDAAWHAAWAAQRAPTVWRTLRTLFGASMVFSGLLCLLGNTAMFCTAFLLQMIVTELSSAAPDLNMAFTFAGLLFVASVTQALSQRHFQFQAYRVGVSARTAVSSAIYRKLLLVPNIRKGDVVTLVSVDANRLCDLAMNGHYLWSSPLGLMVSMALTVNLMGVAALPALGLGVLLAPLNWRITEVFCKIQDKLQKARTKRMALVGEVLQGILVIKLLSWEDVMARRVNAVRDTELKSVRAIAWALAGVMSVITSASALMTVAAFATYTALGNPLTPSIVFPSMFLFGYMTWPLLELPYMISSVSAALTSARRLQSFFDAAEVAGLHGDAAGAAAPEGFVVTPPTPPPTHCGVAEHDGDDVDADTPSVPLLAASDAFALHGARRASWASLDSDSADSTDPARTTSATKLDDDDDGVLSRGNATLVVSRHREEVEEAAAWIRGGTFAWEPTTQLEAESDDDSDDDASSVATGGSATAGADGAVAVTVGTDTGAHASTADAATSSADDDTASAAPVLVPTLHDIDLVVPRGSLVCVVGAVGAGKTSLLQALLGEMRALEGSAGIAGSCAFVPQHAWVRSASIRDNILCGRPFDAARYDATLRACALHADLERLKGGDRCVTGERGVALSGGQKQRVSLARAVYAGADLYLLDDVMSALDAHTGRWIFENCVGGRVAASAATTAANASSGAGTSGTAAFADTDAGISGRPAVLSGATRVLVTHQLQYLPQADLVVVMEGGRVAHSGSYEALVASGVTFTSMTGAAEETDEDPSTIEGDVDATAAVTGAAAGAAASVGKASVDADAPTAKTAPASGAKTHDDERVDGDDADELIDDEERYRGTVGASVYKRYALSLGAPLFVVLLIVLSVGVELSDIAADAWLAYFTALQTAATAEDGRMHHHPATAAAAAVAPDADSTDAAATAPVDMSRFIAGYIGIGVSVALVSFTRHAGWFQAAYIAGRRLHNRMLRSILRAPMGFFDSQPQGRILSRFSKDMGVVDSDLPDLSSDAILCSVSVLVHIVVLAVATPVFLVFVPLLAIPFVFAARYYRRSARELKRLQALSLSPLNSHFTETVEGLTCLRAFELGTTEMARARQLLDVSTHATYISNVADRWISVRIEFVSSCMALVVSMLAVASQIPGAPAFLAGNRDVLALAITYSVGMNGTMNWLVMCTSRTEAEMSRVERCFHYADGETEAPLHAKAVALEAQVHATRHATAATATANGTVERTTPAQVAAAEGAAAAAARHCDAPLSAVHESIVDPRAAALLAPPRHWPRRGEVEFRDVRMRYREGAPEVLRGLSFTAPAGKRVAVVGRTGAGKSSLMSALFRIRELSGGCITIDGVDVSRLGLRDLRSALSLVAQDPILFSGTVRSNLDPNHDGADDAAAAPLADSVLWEALDRVGMKAHVAAQPRKLDSKVEEGGNNLSAGQKQLLVLCRCLLQDTRVVVMDEATSSCDPDSDALIQRTIRRALAGKLVMVVAHRLSTVIDFDKVVVLDAGRVVECGAPAALLADPRGVFSGMVDATGPTSAAFLRRAARTAAAEGGAAASTTTITTTDDTDDDTARTAVAADSADTDTEPSASAPTLGRGPQKNAGIS